MVWHLLINPTYVGGNTTPAPNHRGWTLAASVPQCSRRRGLRQDVNVRLHDNTTSPSSIQVPSQSASAPGAGLPGGGVAGYRQRPPHLPGVGHPPGAQSAFQLQHKFARKKPADGSTGGLPATRGRFQDVQHIVVNRRREQQSRVGRDGIVHIFNNPPGTYRIPRRDLRLAADGIVRLVPRPTRIRTTMASATPSGFTSTFHSPTANGIVNGGCIATTMGHSVAVSPMLAVPT